MWLCAASNTAIAGFCVLSGGVVRSRNHFYLPKKVKAIKEEINSTVILVSQRANTVKNANLIIVMDNGNIVGMGTHKDLLENCEVYKKIYLSQTK